MSKEQVEAFFTEVIQLFSFLQEQYGYQLLEKDIENPDEGRDAIALVSYIGSRVGVQVGWGFAGAAIDVFFIELLQAHVFPSAVSYFPFKDRPNVAKGIHLSTLAAVLGHAGDANFLLKDVENYRTWRKRGKIIQTQRRDVLAGLAHATQVYATPILQGDTSIFPRVMNAYVAKIATLDSTQNFFFYDLDQPS